MQEVFPQRLHPVRGLRPGPRGAAPGPLPRPGLLLQRRHPGHRGGRPGRAPRRPAHHRWRAARPAVPVPRRRQRGDRHRRPAGPAMVQDGVDEAEARARSWLFDVNGLVESSRDDLNDFQRPFAHEHAASRRLRRARSRSCARRRSSASARVGKAFDRHVDRGDGAGQRAADHLPAVQPDVARRVHGRGGLRVVARAAPSWRPAARSAR